jgi:imidazolonepropionase
MIKIIKNISSLVTVNSDGKNIKRGSEMQQIGEIKDGSVVFDDKIIWVGKTSELEEFLRTNNVYSDFVHNAKGKTILPGFVDSHTHLIFAGNRSDEFSKRLRGATYQEIASTGGGILKTMNATRAASLEELVENARQLALSAIKFGTTALEIKSGYGFTLESELKQLEAIKILGKELPIHISATFLGAHDVPPEYKDQRPKYIDIICEEMIPAVAELKLAEFCDAFIDEGYYSLTEGEKILQTALDFGLKLKVHCDELADFGAADLAGKLGAVSADHLLFISEKGMNSLKKAGTIATLLPGTAYNLRLPYAPARKMIEYGMPVALSTDCNPGSCFTENIQLILSLAVINMRMTAEEAISAATLNGAAAIKKSDSMGSLEVGKYANFIITNTDSYTDLFYHFGINHIKEVWVNGIKITENL